ncbi:hypothetical protein AB0A81_34755, partial [Streptomyces flaveolus]
MACFPPQQNGATVRGYAFALGLSALRLVVAPVLTARAAVPVLAVALVLSAALAADRLHGTTAPSVETSRTVDLTLAPVRAAVPASLAALTAPCARVASQAPARSRPARPVARARRAADRPPTRPTVVPPDAGRT